MYFTVNQTEENIKLSKTKFKKKNVNIGTIVYNNISFRFSNISHCQR